MEGAAVVAPSGRLMHFLTDFLGHMNIGQTLGPAAAVATGVVLMIAMWKDGT